MQSAQCIEWSLIIATALLNLSVVSSLLRDHPYNWKSYQKMLATQEKYSETEPFPLLIT